ncbi:MAG: GNAT family N-acetyltransferase [Prevotella sp.]|nr:GNAT family N-acetyltransferase [Prevotella sp.]
MKRDIVILTNNEAEASAEELYILLRSAYQQWTEAGLYTPVAYATLEQFRQYLTIRLVFMAQDEATGELLAMHTLRLNKRKGRADGANLAVSPKAKREGIASRMLEEEVQRLRKAGYRYMMESTGIPATWSVRWHLKNGYHIVGYSRSERNNYASYVFRKQIATDVWHHPADLLWIRPVAPVTAKIRYAVSYIATSLCKTREGRLNRVGRLAKKMLKK